MQSAVPALERAPPRWQGLWSTTMKRILFVTPRYPFPVIGGDKLRIYNVARHLARDYRLTLASLYSTPEEEATAPEAGVFERVYRLRQPALVSGCNAVKNFVLNRPMQDGYFFNGKLASVIRGIAGSHNLVIAHRIRSSGYVRGIEGVPLVCEMTDAISLNYERMRDVGERSLKKLVYSVKRIRCLRSERACLELFDRSVLVSSRDAGYLGGRFPALRDKMSVIPNGVDFERFSPAGYRPRRGKIVFIGNMRTAQNADAARHFAREIFPRVRERFRGATFWIIGADPGPSVRALSGLPGVYVTGRVSSVKKAASDAAVSVCPVRVGAGVQNKVLESMAMGVPVVTTLTGREGLSAEDGKDLLIARSPEDFAGKVVRVLEDHGLGSFLAENGMAHVARNHSWPDLLGAYRDLVGSLMEGPHQARGAKTALRQKAFQTATKPD